MKGVQLIGEKLRLFKSEVDIDLKVWLRGLTARQSFFLHSFCRCFSQRIWMKNVRFENSSQHRAVCDYVAGMTDRYLLEEHARLSEFGPKIDS